MLYEVITGQVKGGVAVANNRNLTGDGLQSFPLLAGKKGETAFHTLEVFSGNTEFAVLPGAGGDYHAVIFFGKSGQAGAEINRFVGSKIDPKPLNVV